MLTGVVIGRFLARSVCPGAAAIRFQPAAMSWFDAFDLFDVVDLLFRAGRWVWRKGREAYADDVARIYRRPPADDIA